MSDRDEPQTIVQRVAVVFAIAAISWGCASSATPTPSTEGSSPSTASEEPISSDDSASTGPAHDGTEPSDEGSSAPPDDGSAPPDDGTPSSRPPTSPPGTATVRFGSVPAKRWGDKPFKVVATASNSAKVAYSASGPCAIGGSNGIVTIKGVGTCQLTAQTASGPAAKDTASLVIRKGLPKITFKGKAVAYSRPFSVSLKASASLPITIKFRKASNALDQTCRVQGTKLTLNGIPELGGLPPLEQSCTVEAYSPSSSNYETPAPVKATFAIAVPNVNIVFAKPSYTLDYSKGQSQSIDFTESSHGVGGVAVDDVSCSDNYSIGATVTPGPTVSDNRTLYHLNLSLDNPGGGSYDCTVRVVATPPDYDRNQPRFRNFVEVTVTA